MAQKCVNGGCQKSITDEEPCQYHPGPAVFHDGQRSWKCCNRRFLMFDESKANNGCTTGKHSAVKDTPQLEKKPAAKVDLPTRPNPVSSTETRGVAPRPQARPTTPPAQAPPDIDSDEPDAPVPPETTCKRRGCGVKSQEGKAATERSGEQCQYHPYEPLFHEASGFWPCCQKRSPHFETFIEIKGCEKRDRHCFTGKKKATVRGDMVRLDTVRHAVMDKGATVEANMYLPKIDKDKSKIEFADDGLGLVLDLRTQDGKCYDATVPLYGKVLPDKSTFKVLGTKLEINFAKADGTYWRVLRSDEKVTGGIIQSGNARTL